MLYVCLDTPHRFCDVFYDYDRCNIMLYFPIIVYTHWERHRQAHTIKHYYGSLILWHYNLFVVCVCICVRVCEERACLNMRSRTLLLPHAVHTASQHPTRISVRGTLLEPRDGHPFFIMRACCDDWCALMRALLAYEMNKRAIPSEHAPAMCYYMDAS